MRKEGREIQKLSRHLKEEKAKTCLKETLDGQLSLPEVIGSEIEKENKKEMGKEKELLPSD